MFRKLFVGFFSIVLFSCSSSKKIIDNKIVVISEEEKSVGLNLIAKNDCYTCHALDKELVGPSFPKIAGKYDATKNNIDALANKVLKGGGGKWGKLPMTPHSTLSSDEAKSIVKYILSIKK